MPAVTAAFGAAVLAICAGTSAGATAPPLSNMNGPYTLANPLSPAAARVTEYSSRAGIEYFDVYSPPIQTRYGTVYWTMMDPVPLPPALVQRFDGKVMAIVGYETDQVVRGNGSTADVSWPITKAYNHHYEAYLTSKHSRMVKVPGNSLPMSENNHGAVEMWMPMVTDWGGVDNASDIPTSQFFRQRRRVPQVLSRLPGGVRAADPVAHHLQHPAHADRHAQPKLGRARLQGWN